jgi:hypothetical protein
MSTARHENPFIVQSDRAVLVEVESPRYLEGRDAHAPSLVMEEKLAHATCHSFLTAAQLKEICRHRGFGAPPGGKDELAAYVAARFNGAEGVSNAMRSLEETYLAALHFIALSETPPGINNLDPLLHPGRGYSDYDRREDFNRLASGLLNRGLVLIHDKIFPDYSGQSRYSRLTFSLPEAHLPLLIPFPIAAAPLGLNCSRPDMQAFLGQALAAAVRRAGGAENNGGAKNNNGSLMEAIASSISFDGGILKVAGAEPTDAGALIRQARRQWTHPSYLKEKRRGTNEFVAASHILSHLPEQQGCTIDALERGLRLLGFEAKREKLELFCSDGRQAGFLARGGSQDKPAYAAAHYEEPSAEAPIAFSAVTEGICIDMERAGIAALCEAARLSRIEIAGGKLRLVPDVARMGRAAAQLKTPTMEAIGQICPAYNKAMRYALERAGKVILHDGLLLFGVHDLGLRTLLLRQFAGKIRSLSGPYLAAPRQLRENIESFARKQGFVPKRMS